jgi:hypothetical protein
MLDNGLHRKMPLIGVFYSDNTPGTPGASFVGSLLIRHSRSVIFIPVPISALTPFQGDPLHHMSMFQHAPNLPQKFPTT